jgi:DNA polymerase I-like protein with 3'-5' exonuclease and polymerase domains
VRECFVPRRGYVFAQADYGILELRALAQVLLAMFGKSAMAEALQAGRELHLEMAARLLSIPYEEAVARKKQTSGFRVASGRRPCRATQRPRTR